MKSAIFACALLVCVGNGVFGQEPQSAGKGMTQSPIVESPAAQTPAPQESTGAIPEGPAITDGGEKPASPRMAQPSSPSGRLPRYFGKVVDDQQRLEIYRIQATYLEKISELEKQLDALRQAEMKEVYQVLTDEQRLQVQSLQEEASSRLAARRTATE